jgi:RHS repeat-associated protein
MAKALVVSFGALAALLAGPEAPASSASTGVPSRAESNLRGIAEFQYRMLSVAVVDPATYPKCNRVCNLLWKRARALDPHNSSSQALWSEMYVLGVRDGLFGGFTDYRWGVPFSTVSSPMTKVVLGEQPHDAGAPPQRFLGVAIPRVSSPDGGGLVMPHTLIRGSISADETIDGRVITPNELGWAIDAGFHRRDPRCGDAGVEPEPQAGWQPIQAVEECFVWDPGQQTWLHFPGVEENGWWIPAAFDGAPSATEGSYDPSPLSGPVSHYVTGDPGIDDVEEAIEAQFSEHSEDYGHLLPWIRTQLGDGDAFWPRPQAFYGLQNPAAPNLVHTCAGDPVQCASGNFLESFQDTRVAGPGINLSVARTYNSQAAVDQPDAGPLGYGWAASFTDHLELVTGTGDVIVHQAGGSEVIFTLNDEDGSYSSDDFVQATLTKTDDVFTLTLPSQLKLRFSSGGRLLSETDAHGNITSLSYAGSALTTVTDAVGRTLTYTHNPDGTIATITDPAGRVVHYGYTAGDLTSVQETGGQTTEFAYDDEHQIISVTDARNHVVTTNVYDDEHRVISQQDAQQHETTWDYSTPGKTVVTDPSGAVTEETFQHGLPVSITSAQGTPSQATTSYDYDENFDQVAVTDGNGRHWKSVYDLRGNRIRETDPLDRTTRYTYDNLHRVTQVITPGGVTTSMEYDSHGNLERVRKAPVPPQQVKSTMYEYNSRGQLTAIDDASWATTRFTTFDYDSHGNRIATTTPNHHQSTATYDADGLQLTATDARNKTTTTVRDAVGLPITVTDPQGYVTTYAYDAGHNLTDVTDGESRHTSTTFDALNRPTAVHRPDGTTWSTTYTAGGEIATRTDGAGNVTSYTYDHQHRLRTTTDPLSRVTTYTYDDAGNQTGIEDSGGHDTTLGYDGANELTSINYDSPATPDVAYTYTDDSQRASMTDGTGTTTYTYDGLDRLTGQTAGDGQHTGYHYDDWDRVTAIDYPDALTATTVGSGTPPTHVSTGTVTRHYDNDDNLTSVSDWLGNTTTFSYDANDNLTAITRPNGVNATYTYDDDSQLAALTDNTTSSLSRDHTGLLTSTTIAGTTTSYGYDAAQRLTSASSRPYGYDDADNLTHTATATGTAVLQDFDDANQLTSRSQAATPTDTFTYDAEGRRTAQTPATGTATQLSWSQAGSLLSYDGPDHRAAGTTSLTESYSYDGDGLRQTTTTEDQRTHLAYDQSGGLPEIITDGPTAYITGPGGLPLEQISQNGTVRWLHHDQLGSTTSITAANGTTIQTYTYDAYGQLTSAPPTAENPFRFAGQYTNDTTGLQYLRARYYDPATGQFLSRDPLEDTTLQPYAYAANAPTAGVDPSGLSVTTEISDAVSAVVPPSVSDAAAHTLDFITGGAATDIACNGLTWGNAFTGGANIAMTFVPGGRVGKLGEELAVKGTEQALARTVPRNLAEKLSLDEANAGAGRRIMQGKIKDPRYPGNVWAKMQHIHENPDGTKSVIHYWENLQTGAREGFKFK